MPNTATDEGGAERWFWSSRAGLSFVALLVSVPAPWAALWGGSTSGQPFSALAVGATWILLSFLLPRLLRAGASDFFSEPVAGVSICLDVVGLTALLSVAGAAQNPFTLLYFVPITLATIVAQKWTIRVAALSVVGFGLLLLETTLSLAEHRHHGAHAHFFQHVRGMAIALAVAGAFVTIFVHRIGRSLAQKERRIAELSRQRQQDHLAIALGTLSAGAAHELGSPLGSVQLLAEELPHLSPAEQKVAVSTIVAEVQRMKAIVHSMDTSELSAETLRGGKPWRLLDLCAEAEALGVSCPALPDEKDESTQPYPIVSQITRELIRNAFGVKPDCGVSMSLVARSDAFVVTIEDDGPGFSSEQKLRATEPFVSYTGGTGLGLFLASIHARQLGGELLIESEAGRGAKISLRLPRQSRVSGAAL
jgi:two-component system sensor histidine kinase RegB